MEVEIDLAYGFSTRGRPMDFDRTSPPADSRLACPPPAGGRSINTPAGCRPIEEWHICISGFTQNLGRPSGLELLWSKIRNRHHNGRVCVMDPRTWNDNWAHVAEFIWRLRPPHAAPRIGVYAYSWGAGWGFPQLARECAKRGLVIDVAVLADPVYRHWYRAGNWRAFWPLSTIRVPRSVDRVHWFYQSQNWPRGHRVVAEDPTCTAIWPGMELSADHAYMDDAREFHELALHAAEKLG